MDIILTVKMTKIRRLFILLTSIFLMLLFYPKIEEVILITEENRSVRDFIKNSETTNIEIAVLKLEDVEQFKHNILILSKEHNVDFYFTDYDTDLQTDIHIYAIFSSQRSLDLLPIKPTISIDVFNELEYPISNTNPNGQYVVDVLPTKYEQQNASIMKYPKTEIIERL